MCHSPCAQAADQHKRQPNRRSALKWHESGRARCGCEGCTEGAITRECARGLSGGDSRGFRRGGARSTMWCSPGEARADRGPGSVRRSREAGVDTMVCESDAGHVRRRHHRSHPSSRTWFADRQSGWHDVLQAVSVYDFSAGKPATTGELLGTVAVTVPSTSGVFQVRHRTSAGAGSSRTVIVSGAKSNGRLT